MKCGIISLIQRQLRTSLHTLQAGINAASQSVDHSSDSDVIVDEY